MTLMAQVSYMLTYMHLEGSLTTQVQSMNAVMASSIYNADSEVL